MSLIFHVDANSAYLSWSAVNMLQQGYPVDLRDIPSVIGGTQATRHGIVLTKSIPAKRAGVKTGMSLMEAGQVCPNLTVVHPDYDLYMLCSEAMNDILQEYTPIIQRYSIDESFLDMTASVEGRKDPVGTADAIRQRIQRELGFTVNVGVSNNMLLAKMAGELKKPNMTHTLWPDEIPAKMWPLPVGELFMVGRASEAKLKKYGIETIGDLAHFDEGFLHSIMHSHGRLIYNYANGRDSSVVGVGAKGSPLSGYAQKGVGNSMTFSYDLCTSRELEEKALALCERVGQRLRRLGRSAGLVTVILRTGGLYWYSHQVQMGTYICTTSEIFDVACSLLEEMWRGEPIRQMGIRVSDFAEKEAVQLSMFDRKDKEEQEKLERAIDLVRVKFGQTAIIRGRFANTGIRPIEGSVNGGNFIMMGGFRQE